MNVNRRMILVSKMCYDKIYGQLCTFLPKVLFTWFYISDRLLGCQEQPLLERYAWYLNMFASLSFVNPICQWKPHTLMWQNLEEKDLWLALQKSIFFCYYLAKSDGVFNELYKNRHSFIIWLDLSNPLQGSFAIDTQMPIVLYCFLFFCGGGGGAICIGYKMAQTLQMYADAVISRKCKYKLLWECNFGISYCIVLGVKKTIAIFCYLL